jgi:hypothetical protein
MNTVSWEDIARPATCPLPTCGGPLRRSGPRAHLDGHRTWDCSKCHYWWWENVLVTYHTTYTSLGGHGKTFPFKQVLEARSKYTKTPAPLTVNKSLVLCTVGCGNRMRRVVPGMWEWRRRARVASGMCPSCWDKIPEQLRRHLPDNNPALIDAFAIARTG